jgi:uncharacterized protein
MSFPRDNSRRKFIQSASLLTAGVATSRSWIPGIFAATEGAGTAPPLEQFSYGDVKVASELHNQQLEQTHSVLMGLSEDSLMKPFRQMGGQPAPGEELGGWYKYDPDYDWHTFDAGFAPAATFGQWVSALARYFAITGDRQTREKILRLNRLYAETISGDLYEKNRFPAYCYDKLVCGLIDSHQLAGDPDAFRILERTTDTALPHLPGKAIEHGHVWRPGKDESWTWDESYTMPENLFLAYQRGAGERYRALAIQYLHDEYFDPFAEGRSAFAGKHAYSHVNALCSAMQAYLTLGNEKYLRVARNAFDMLTAQSFATGGWGPDEQLRAPDSDDVYASLTGTHSSFETPCGSYAHFKLTRYLLRVSRESRYGDSMERVMYNTILGANPLQPDGRTFYYADCNFKGRKVYSSHRWPCCSGTMPQIAADYGISSYFRDPRGIYVNLYIPSSVQWSQGGATISLTQKSAYPFDSLVQFEVTASKPSEFAVNFRIPMWAEGASISVNGKRAPGAAIPGSFARVQRKWKTGDRVELELPLTKRLEPIDPRHPKTVALLCGPLVLFAITESAPVVTGPQLLSAKKVGKQDWQVETAAGPLKMLPFTAISDEQYSTYLALT